MRLIPSLHLTHSGLAGKGPAAIRNQRRLVNHQRLCLGFRAVSEDCTDCPDNAHQPGVSPAAVRLRMARRSHENVDSNSTFYALLAAV